MGFVSLSTNELVIKLFVAGAPGVGKSHRVRQLAAIGEVIDFGAPNDKPRTAARVPLPPDPEAGPGTRRPLLEVYEWHGYETVDLRGRRFDAGVDAVLYLADARQGRIRESGQVFRALVSRLGRSRMRRMPLWLMLGQSDQGSGTLEDYDRLWASYPGARRVCFGYGDGDGFCEEMLDFAQAVLAWPRA